MNLRIRMITSDSVRLGPPSRMTVRQLLRVALLGFGTSVVPLDSAVNIAFPDITTHFDLPIQMIQWVVICYVLTHASLMLAFGRVGDIFGHARVFRTGLLWNGAALLCCAVAPSFGWLLFCRFLQGIGASLILSCAPALLTSLFPEDRRSTAIAVFTAMHAVGSAGGPLLGGVLVDIWGWPAVFWFRAPIALTALAFLKGLPPAPRGGAREPVDVFGAALLALAISTALLSLNQLQQLGQHLFMLTVPGIALAAAFGFILRERGAACPIINPSLFRVRGFAAANGASFLVNLTSFSVLLFAPYYLVRHTELPLPLAGAVLAASAVGSIAASPVAGALIERLPAAWIAAFGAALSGVGLCMIGGWEAGASAVAMVTTLGVHGFGVGLFQVAYMVVVMATLPRQHRGVAGSLTMLTRTLGVVTGAALLTLIFHTLDAAAVADGASPEDGFIAAFGSTFRLAGGTAGLAAIVIAVSCVRRR